MTRTSSNPHSREILEPPDFRSTGNRRFRPRLGDGRTRRLIVYPLRTHTIDDRPARIHFFEKMLEFWKLYL